MVGSLRFLQILKHILKQTRDTLKHDTLKSLLISMTNVAFSSSNADLAKAQLIISHSDQAKRTRKLKDNYKHTTQDEENKDLSDEAKRKRPASIAVVYVIQLDHLLIC